MRTRVSLLSLTLYLMLVVLGCTSKPSIPADNTTDANRPADSAQATEKHEHHEAKRQPIVVPAGTAITVSLGSALGSKLSRSGDTFTGTVAKAVELQNKVVIPAGSNVSGTVTDAKPLGKFKGGAELQLRLDSISVKGADLAVQANARSFTAKGKGKRTAVLTGGGAALGGLIGGLAGGGKGAAIGLAAGAGAGAGGSALTGNKDIVLPAESAVSFELTEPLEIR
jgi:hypothetical protein